MKKDELIFVEHILESIKNVEFFMKGVSKQSFLENKEKQSAVVRQIEVIGEAAKNLPSKFLEKYPLIPWKDIIGARDKIIHHYFGLDLGTIWDILDKDLPDLKKKILKIKEQLNK